MHFYHDPETINFQADVMLGRLARYLIHTGYDCKYDQNIKDRRIVEEAHRHERVLLTKDSDIVELNKKPIRSFTFSQGTLRGHLKSLQQAFKLTFQPETYFTRCSTCNVELNNIPEKSAIEFVPEDSREYVDNYFRCPDCQTVYWKGSHYRELVDKLRNWGLSG